MMTLLTPKTCQNRDVLTLTWCLFNCMFILCRHGSYTGHGLTMPAFAVRVYLLLHLSNLNLNLVAIQRDLEFN